MKLTLLGEDKTEWSGKISFLVLLVSQLISTTAFMFVVPFMPLYVQELGVHDPGHAAAWAGLINGASGATMALVAPLWGRLADRYGRKPMLLRATLTASVVILLMHFVTSPWQLLALRLLQGTLTGTVPAATSLVASSSPSGKTGFRLGALQMVIFIAAGVGPALGGTSADLAGIRTSFFIASGLLAFAGMIVMFGVKEIRTQEEKSHEEEEDSEVSPLPYRLLLPGLLALFTVHVTITSASVALPGFIGSISDGGIASKTGWLLGAAALVAAVGSPLGGRLASRFGTRRVIVVSLALAGLVAIPQAFAATLPELWALRLILGLFLGCTVPVANLLIKEASPPERQGAAFGVASSATSAGFALGPLGGGLLSSAFGFWTAFLVPGIALLTLSVAMMIVGTKPYPARRIGAVLRTTMMHLMK